MGGGEKNGLVCCNTSPPASGVADLSLWGAPCRLGPPPSIGEKQVSNLPGNAASLLNDTGAPSTSGITGEEGREEGTGGEEGGGGKKREQERRRSPAEHRGKKKTQRMRRAVVGPRPGAPWVRRGPGPGRHGGRPLAVTPSVHLRPRAGNPEKPPGGPFSRRVPASGPGRGPDRRGRGPLVPGRTRPSPREGPNERNIPATERKTPQTGLKNRNRNPPPPKRGKQKTDQRPAGA